MMPRHALHRSIFLFSTQAKTRLPLAYTLPQSLLLILIEVYLVSGSFPIESDFRSFGAIICDTLCEPVVFEGLFSGDASFRVVLEYAAEKVNELFVEWVD